MPTDGNKSMTKKEIIKEISDVTGLKTEVSSSVLNAFADILIREAVMTGKFVFSNCFSIDTHIRSARRQFNVSSGEYKDYPETKILGIKLSKKINSFNRWKQRHEYNSKHGLTVDDWKNREGPDLPK